MTQRYFLKLAFDGSHYHGWQRQDNALSIEHLVNEALNTILRQKVNLTGCGRTDAGVHAREFFVHFDLDRLPFSEEQFAYKLTCLLPDDIVITKVLKVTSNAHARFSAVKRTYKYYINSKRDPFGKNYEYFFNRKLDTVLMNQACKILMDYKNFSCFSKSHTQVNNYLCTIFEARWETNESRYNFTITANRFLRNMVRAIVGTMMDVGLHKISLEEFRNIIENGSRSDAGMSVPAQGLFLTEIIYPSDTFVDIE